MEGEVCCMPGYGTDLLQDGFTGAGNFQLKNIFFILIMLFNHVSKIYRCPFKFYKLFI